MEFRPPARVKLRYASLKPQKTPRSFLSYATVETVICLPAFSLHDIQKRVLLLILARFFRLELLVADTKLVAAIAHEDAQITDA